MNDISITIKHEDTTIDFKGHPNDVLHSVNEFLLKSIPGLDLAQKILINYSKKDIHYQQIDISLNCRLVLE